MRALAVVAACLMITLAVRGSEPVDSGWIVATPSTVLGGDHPADPKIRIAINHVLEQSQVPLLQMPAQQRPSTDAASVDDETYEAAADGWRPAHIPTDLPGITPEYDSSKAPDIAPRFRSATSDRQRIDEEKVNERAVAPAPTARAATKPKTAAANPSPTETVTEPPATNQSPAEAASPEDDNVVVTDTAER